MTLSWRKLTQPVHTTKPHGLGAHGSPDVIHVGVRRVTTLRDTSRFRRLTFGTQRHRCHAACQGRYRRSVGRRMLLYRTPTSRPTARGGSRSLMSNAIVRGAREPRLLVGAMSTMTM